MNPKSVRLLLEKVRDGDLGIEDAAAKLRDLPFRDLGFAKVDHHRELRTGFPEVILGEGKTPSQLIDLVRELGGGESPVLATRVSVEQAARLREEIPDADYDSLSSCQQNLDPTRCVP